MEDDFKYSQTFSTVSTSSGLLEQIFFSFKSQQGLLQVSLYPQQNWLLAQALLVALQYFEEIYNLNLNHKIDQYEIYSSDISGSQKDKMSLDNAISLQYYLILQKRFSNNKLISILKQPINSQPKRDSNPQNSNNWYDIGKVPQLH
ncbi:hypothetical protein pb186bvf_014356 [Paramecium bursaria]